MKVHIFTKDEFLPGQPCRPLASGHFEQGDPGLITAIRQFAKIEGHETFEPVDYASGHFLAYAENFSELTPHLVQPFNLVFSTA